MLYKKEPGWMGGTHCVDGVDVEAEYFDDKYITVDGVDYKLKTRNTGGVDYDYGHRYRWENFDVGISGKTVIGTKIFVTMSELEETKKCKFEIKSL
jgi:hypothetical protein